MEEKQEVGFKKCLYGKMLKIQLAMPKLIKDSANPFFKSNYANIAAVNATIREGMDKAATYLLIRQIPATQYEVGGRPMPEIIVTTIVTDPESGEDDSYTLSGYPVEDKIQAIGSTITYLRRYTLMSVFNQSPEDDDGNAASGAEEPGKYPSRKPAQGPVKASQPVGGTQTSAKAETKAAGLPVDGKNGESVPSLKDVNQKLATPRPASMMEPDDVREAKGLINMAEFNELNALLKKELPTKEGVTQWKAWLKMFYGFDNAGQITKAAYYGQAAGEGKDMLSSIIEIVKNQPVMIKNYLAEFTRIKKVPVCPWP
jgi:hypothetical protein